MNSKLENIAVALLLCAILVLLIPACKQSMLTADQSTIHDYSKDPAYTDKSRESSTKDSNISVVHDPNALNYLICVFAPSNCVEQD